MPSSKMKRCLILVRLRFIACPKRQQIRYHRSSTVVAVFVIIQAAAITVPTTTRSQMQCGHPAGASSIHIYV